MRLEARARDLAELAALDAEEQAEPIAMVAAQLHDGVIEFLEAGNQLIMAIEQQSGVDEDENDDYEGDYDSNDDFSN